MSRRVITDDDLYPVPAPAQVPGAPAQFAAPAVAMPLPLGAPPAAAQRRPPRAVILAGLVLGAIVLVVIGFFGGRATRPTDTHIAAEVHAAEQRVHDEALRQQDDALATQRRTLAGVRERAVARAAKAARASGRAEGLSEGRAQGTADGTATGRAIGVQEGQADNLCYTTDVLDATAC